MSQKMNNKVVSEIDTVLDQSGVIEIADTLATEIVILTYRDDEDLIYTEDTESNEQCFSPNAQEHYDDWYRYIAKLIARLNRNK